MDDIQELLGGIVAIFIAVVLLICYPILIAIIAAVLFAAFLALHYWNWCVAGETDEKLVLSYREFIRCRDAAPECFMGGEYNSLINGAKPLYFISTDDCGKKKCTRIHFKYHSYLLWILSKPFFLLKRLRKEKRTWRVESVVARMEVLDSLHDKAEQKLLEADREIYEGSKGMEEVLSRMKQESTQQ